MNVWHLVTFGLLIAFLSMKTEAKPLTQVQQKSLRIVLGEELSEYLASGERERKLDNMRSGVHLLRDLQLDTRSKGMWTRILNDQPSLRKHKPGSKKGTSSSRGGCFGHKMDRIGTISGMGC